MGGDKTRNTTLRGEKVSNHLERRVPESIASLEAVDPLVELLDPDDEVGDGVEEPVEDEGGGDEEGVALALHDGLLVAEVLGRGAGGVGLAPGAGLVLPVDVHEEEEAEGDDGEEGLQEVAGDGDEAPPEAVEARDGQEEHHDRLRAGGVAEDHPLERHRSRRRRRTTRSREASRDPRASSFSFFFFGLTGVLGRAVACDLLRRCFSSGRRSLPFPDFCYGRGPLCSDTWRLGPMGRSSPCSGLNCSWAVPV